MERTQELFEKIELYLSQELPAQEVIAFEKEISMDSELELEVEKHRELQRVLSDTDTLLFKEKLHKISTEIKQESSEESTTSYSLFWKIAASIIIVFGVWTLLWDKFTETPSKGNFFRSAYIRRVITVQEPKTAKSRSYGEGPRSNPPTSVGSSAFS